MIDFLIRQYSICEEGSMEKRDENMVNATSNIGNEMWVGLGLGTSALLLYPPSFEITPF